MLSLRRTEQGRVGSLESGWFGVQALSLGVWNLNSRPGQVENPPSLSGIELVVRMIGAALSSLFARERQALGWVAI